MDRKVFRLLQVQGEDNTQEEFEGSKSKKHAYDRISDELHVYGLCVWYH